MRQAARGWPLASRFATPEGYTPNFSKGNLAHFQDHPGWWDALWIGGSTWVGHSAKGWCKPHSFWSSIVTSQKYLGYM